NQRAPSRLIRDLLPYRRPATARTVRRTRRGTMTSLEQDLYEEAKTRVRKRRDLSAHFAAYIGINTTIVSILAIPRPGGNFWPAWLMLAWGCGLILNVWDVYFRRPVTERDIEREMERLGPGS